MTSMSDIVWISSPQSSPIKGWGGGKRRGAARSAGYTSGARSGLDKVALRAVRAETYEEERADGRVHVLIPTALAVLAEPPGVPLARAALDERLLPLGGVGLGPLLRRRRIGVRQRDRRVVHLLSSSQTIQ